MKNNNFCELLHHIIIAVQIQAGIVLLASVKLPEEDLAQSLEI